MRASSCGRPRRPRSEVRRFSGSLALICEQKRAPFGLDLQRFEGAPLDRIRHVTIGLSSSAWPIEQDWFGVGTYLTLAESEALNNARSRRRNRASAFRLTRPARASTAR